MCVIAVYPKGIPFDNAELKLCFKNNPDGAGVMWQEGDKVHIHKGFMKQKALFNFLKTLPTDVDRVIHFRIATSGRVSVACCHPFPIVDDYKTMMKTELVVPVAYAHNGVLVDYTPKAGMKSTFSDTMVFGREVLSHLLKANVDLFDPVIDAMLESTIDGDRMVIMDSKETITMGKFLTSNKSGARYSNASYSYDRSSWKNYGCGSLWGYYDDRDCTSYNNKTNAKNAGSTRQKHTTVVVEKTDVCVSFIASVTIDTTNDKIKGYTRDDFEQFVMDNLAEVNVYGVNCIIDSIEGSKTTFSVECMAYVDDLQYPFYNIYEGKAMNDWWRSKSNIRDVPVNIAVSDVTFDDASEAF